MCGWAIDRGSNQPGRLNCGGSTEVVLTYRLPYLEFIYDNFIDAIHFFIHMDYINFLSILFILILDEGRHLKNLMRNISKR